MGDFSGKLSLNLTVVLYPGLHAERRWNRGIVTPDEDPDVYRILVVDSRLARPEITTARKVALARARHRTHAG